ncbi:glycosyltransferase family protein [Nostoc piscinale]|uniref:glycosyltransferase family protein n=1 Tax=Nostoc piscinale TaxID=224012 RepID=UPI000A62EA03
MNSYRNSQLHIDVVLQATGVHGWSASHGWINTLQREGLLNRVFRPVAGWGIEEPLHDDGLFEYLQNPQADIILMLGFDWHSQPLHTTLKWQERWHQSPIIKIAILQECYSTHIVQNTPVWQQQMHQAITSTIPCVDGLVCNHEPDVDFLQKQLGISLPIIFLPFGIDPEFFRINQPFVERFNRGLFRGNAPRYFTEESYKQRHQLIEVLSRCHNVDLFSTNLHYEQNPLQIMQEYVQEINKYQIVLNLPSNSTTLTARPFEVMGCGSLLLQNKIFGIQSQNLLKDWEHLVYYDAEQPEDLIEKIEYLISNPELTEKIAVQGYNLCHDLHTLKCRITSILEWVNTNIPIKVKQCEENNRTHRFFSHSAVNFKIIIDGIFFQLYQTGIARVWKSLLEEWAENKFAQHILLLDRDGTAPKIGGIKYANISAYDYNDTNTDKQMLQQICDDEGADLFISSYYTTPLTTPSVFMAYDMIPEVLGWDVINNPMWREKHLAIQSASACIAISQHTARDINKCFPEISVESITVAHCGVSSTFSQAKTEDVNSFKSKYGITKPYFILVGAGNGYKNGMLFFQAFAQLANSYGFDIICTGSGGILASEFRACTSGSTVYMLQLSDEELATAYSGAVALVYPSKYEGFGMPIVEAMACGCPVITCPNASIPEVAGDAAIYVKDDDVDGMANALCDIQKPRIRQVLIEAGLVQAQKFSWSKMAEIVSSSLINASLLSLKLKEVNVIVFPNWSQSEELIGLELEAVIKAIATYPDSQKTTLLIYTSNSSTEDAELLISGITMNLLMEEDLDISEGLEISLVGSLADIQWQALLPRLSSRIILEHEDKTALAELPIEALPTCELDSFINQLCVL